MAPAIELSTLVRPMSDASSTSGQRPADEADLRQSAASSARYRPRGSAIAATEDGQPAQVAAGSVEQPGDDQLGHAAGERQDAKQHGHERRTADGQRERDDDVEAGEHGDDALGQGKQVIGAEAGVAETTPVFDCRCG